MRTRSRQAKPPSAEVPGDRGDQQGEDHGKTGGAAHLKDQFDGKERDNPEGNRAGREENPEEIEEA